MAVSLLDGGRAIPRADSLRFLSAARDTVLVTLQGSAHGPGGEPGVAGGLDRERLVEAFVEGPIFEPDWGVEPLDTSHADLDDRSFVIDKPRWGSAGWVDNGLRIQVDLADGEDPEQVLSVVVPGVLDELGLT